MKLHINITDDDGKVLHNFAVICPPSEAATIEKDRVRFAQMVRQEIEDAFDTDDED